MEALLSSSFTITSGATRAGEMVRRISVVFNRFIVPTSATASCTLPSKAFLERFDSACSVDGEAAGIDGRESLAAFGDRVLDNLERKLLVDAGRAATLRGS